MPVLAPRPADLKAMADDILWLNRDSCASLGIELGWGRCDGVAPLALDAQLMEQALLNIVKNAVEAAAERQQGFVRIELADEERRVRLSVVNSGDLPPDGARKLFEPFFTTKKGGQGIGLMFVREVLARHGCAYALVPAGAGETRFDIWFDKQDRFG
jgi:two-component system nitrogen regulation sensor histidine kinase NtrY